MTFQNSNNHPITLMMDDTVVHQLLAVDNADHDFMQMHCVGHLIIPWCMPFSSRLLPEIVIPKGSFYFGGTFPDPLFPGIVEDF